MKKICALALALVLVFCMVGCDSEKNSKVSNLSGTCKQSNSKLDDSYQEAVISGDQIEIFWVSDGGDSKSLYWAGTYEAP